MSENARENFKNNQTSGLPSKQLKKEPVSTKTNTHNLNFFYLTKFLQCINYVSEFNLK